LENILKLEKENIKRQEVEEPYQMTNKNKSSRAQKKRKKKISNDLLTIYKESEHINQEEMFNSTHSSAEIFNPIEATNESI
jgi:regulator of replication initiation timing